MRTLIKNIRGSSAAYEKAINAYRGISKTTCFHSLIKSFNEYFRNPARLVLRILFNSFLA